MSDHVVLKEFKKLGFQEDDEKGECRICHEEEFVKNLEAPCACNGSLKLAHRACIQQWCNEKRSTVCEICKQMTFLLLYLALLICVFTWIRSLSGPRPRIWESSAGLTDIPVAMPIPNSMHHRRVVQPQSESDEDKDYVNV